MLKPFFVLALILLSACASRHELMRGSVALKVNESNGIVCTEPYHTNVGDHLFLYNNVCSKEGIPDKRGSAVCKLVKEGEVEITKILNEHYAEFKTLSSINFEEGSIIRP